MNFIDLFSGIGGFRRGLERSGHTAVGHVEIDKFANESYMAMYGLIPCKFDKDENGCMMCSLEVGKNCDGENCKGEWYRKDIKRIGAEEIPKAEIWTFGFPCTDISLSGKRAGLCGERSGLFFEVARLLKGQNTENKPRWIIVENVKHLLSIERGGAFTTVLSELSQIGYDCQWQVQNSKFFGVPQHRERVYIVGHLRETSGREIFPLGRANKTPVKQVVGGSQGNRIYEPSGLSVTLVSGAGGFGGKTGLYAVPSFVDMNDNAVFTDTARCVRARQNAGITNHKGEASGVIVPQCCCMNNKDVRVSSLKDENFGIFYCNQSCVRAVITPDRVNKRQNGRRFKEDGEPSFTLTYQDKYGVLLCKCDDEVFCCRIRRLTPREFFRLQAFDDFLFDRAKAAGISDVQLYKQAGNAVTVNIVYEIGLKLCEEVLP
ncbi:MAG: DNA (cytosine-5-)-methyltransferase [Clostridia bacterium]